MKGTDIDCEKSIQNRLKGKYIKKNIYNHKEHDIVN